MYPTGTKVGSMGTDNTSFQNRNVVSNVGDVVSVQLPAGEYSLCAGEAAPGLTVSDSGLVSGSPTTPGVYTMVLEFCCD